MSVPYPVGRTVESMISDEHLRSPSKNLRIIARTSFSSSCVCPAPGTNVAIFEDEMMIGYSEPVIGSKISSSQKSR